MCGRSLAMNLIRHLPDLLGSRDGLSLGDSFRYIFSPTTVHSLLQPRSARGKFPGRVRVMMESD